MNAAVIPDSAEHVAMAAVVATAAEPQGPRLQVLNVLQPAYGQGMTYPAQGEVLEKLMKRRDELAHAASNGRFMDAASREWKLLPRGWREDLLLLAGLGADMHALQALAGRDWHEIPPPERMRVSGVVRGAKMHLTGLVAIAARG